MSTENTLAALLTQLQFELLKAGAAVATASQLGTRMEHELAVQNRRCEQLATQLGGAMLQPRLNPELIQTLHRLYRAELSLLRDADRQLTEARSQEKRLRAELTSLRNRERSLQRAKQAECRKQKAKWQAAEGLRADDLWLQRGWSS